MSFLITGGTGSFGQAFTRHLLQHGAERVCILSRGEHAQAEMRQAFDDDQRLRFFIGDVRDRDRLRRAFEGIDVIVHAAALKRIEVGHYNPLEMVRTNIDGAVNVIEAAIDAGVKKIVALSSDKAFEPISPYGQTKALAEALFLGANRMTRPSAPIFAVARYGNVAGSRGSVIPKWRSMRLAGHTVVPVTDPGCTRFWMRMDEAVALVDETIRTMTGGEINIPTLPAYRLGDLAEAMGAKTEIVGLQSWEKKHENMAADLCSATAPRMTIPVLKASVAAL